VRTVARTSGTEESQFGEPQPRRLIITIYGLYGRDEHNWLSVASLVRLMSDLGVDGQSVRSSVSRLKRRDMLRSLHRAGAAGYALSPASLEVLREGDVRIFARRRATLGDGWAVVVFSVPETERAKRHELRTRLAHLGFGTVAPGVWLAPGTMARDVSDALACRQLAGYVDIFRADHLGYADLADRVRQWWDLDGLSAKYAQFIERYRPLSQRVARHGLPGDQQAFREYVSMLIAWQRLPYLDPGLPLELLPAGWSGVSAGNLFAEINEQLNEAAMRHAVSLIHP
jgi:phenylacetic acid degradation operon negative regulatory protein